MKRTIVPFLLTLLCLPLAPAVARTLPPPATAPAATVPAGASPAPQAPQAPPTVTLDFKDVPLRQALEQLFRAANVAYVIPADLISVPVNTAIKDTSLNDALRQLLVGAGTAERTYSYKVEGSTYQIQAREKNRSAQAVPPQLIPVNYASAQELLQQITGATLLPPGVNSVLLQNNINQIIAQGDLDSIQQLRNTIQLLDVAPVPVQIKLELVAVGGKNKTRSTLFSTILQTVIGKAVESEESLKDSQKFFAQLTPTLNGDGVFSVSGQWEVTLLLPSGDGKEVTQLHKRATVTTQIRNKETMMIGGTIVQQGGIASEVLCFATVTAVSNGDKKETRAAP